MLQERQKETERDREKKRLTKVSAPIRAIHHAEKHTHSRTTSKCIYERTHTHTRSTMHAAEDMILKLCAFNIYIYSDAEMAAF